jgi:hypothetical protein
LLLFLCTASALLRPALLSSGTDVSFLDRTLLEKDIAAVFNKVNFIFYCCSMKRSYFSTSCEYTIGIQNGVILGASVSPLQVNCELKSDQCCLIVGQE